MTTHYHQTPAGPVAFTSDEEAELVAQQTGAFQAAKDYYYARVYQLVNQIIDKSIGSLTSDLQIAEADARAYKAAGYSGAAPATVSDYAAIYGASNKDLADIVIAQADLRTLRMIDLRKHRLQALSDISAASTPLQLNNAVAVFDTFIVGFAGIPAT